MQLFCFGSIYNGKRRIYIRKQYGQSDTVFLSASRGDFTDIDPRHGADEDAIQFQPISEYKVHIKSVLNIWADDRFFLIDTRDIIWEVFGNTPPNINVRKIGYYEKHGSSCIYVREKESK